MTETRHPAGHELQAYHDGELGTDVAARLAVHCETCARCRTDLSELERMDGLLAGIAEPELSRSVWPDVAAARRSNDGSRLGAAFRFASATACAAGIAIGILLGPVHFSTESASDEAAWAGPTTLWNGGTSSALLEVYQSDLE